MKFPKKIWKTSNILKGFNQTLFDFWCSIHNIFLAFNVVEESIFCWIRQNLMTVAQKACLYGTLHSHVILPTFYGNSITQMNYTERYVETFFLIVQYNWFSSAPEFIQFVL